MLAAMREIALLDLNARCHQSGLDLNTIRAQHGEYLAPLLVEAGEKITQVYLLQRTNDTGVVRMWVEELDDAKRRRLPFNKPSGAQSPALGPVFKRTSKPKENPPCGPSIKIQNTTAKEFTAQAQSGELWSGYFNEICRTLFRSNTLQFNDQTYPVGDDCDDQHILAAAVRLISAKETVFLAVVDANDHWPGDRPEYQTYLAQELARIKYVTGEAAAYTPATCPLCGATDVTLYPNLRGTGINFSNMDRVGAFPGLEVKQAWKSYGLCLECADLLYIFKNHLLTQQFTGFIAGDKALLLPSLLGNTAGRQQFMRDWRQYVKAINDGGHKLGSLENDLLEFVQERDDAQVVVHILWATFGQVIDDVRGVVTDVLPSRLRDLSKTNRAANNWQHPLAPRYLLKDAAFDLNLTALLALFKRPGGKRAAAANDSQQLFAIKRQLAEAIYHATPLGDSAVTVWRELLITARWRLDEIAKSGHFSGLLYEGYSTKGNKQSYYWTLAGWIRHVARLLYYLDNIGVLPMTEMNTEPLQFEPSLAALKPYFQAGSGLNTREKAFTFLLGVLYGKVLQVQAARGVNVASNALTWLKRLNLDGRDLPDLYCKIREKLLSYAVEANSDVRAVVNDLGRLGGQSLGNTIALDQTATCYFLLLGQSVTVDVLPTKSSQSKPVEDE